MRLYLFILTAVILISVCAVAPVFAEVDPGKYIVQAEQQNKMHFPQYPADDEFGMNVNFTCGYLDPPNIGKVLADDWTCSNTGNVDFIHFWFSALGDWFDLGSPLTDQIVNIHLSIHSNIPGPPSLPGPVLWEADFAPDDIDHVQINPWPNFDGHGWFDPNTGEYIPGDHIDLYWCAIGNIPNPFHQEWGTVYWLDITIETTESVAPPDSLLGWAAADIMHYPESYAGNHYLDDAVWGECGYLPNPAWMPMIFPPGHPWTPESLDLAFVIGNSEEIPTLSEWGLIVLLLVLIAAGALFVRQRRRAAA
jgi:hypothetical protein